MAPSQSPLHGLNLVVPPDPQHLSDSHSSHDLLSGPHFPDLAAQLDLWTNLTFESDEPLVRDSLKGGSRHSHAHTHGQGHSHSHSHHHPYNSHSNIVNNSSLDGIGALSSCSADEYNGGGNYNNSSLDGIGALSSCSADEYGSGFNNPSLDGLGGLSSCSSADDDNDNIASSDGHVNVVNPSVLPQHPHFPQGVDLNSILNAFGINPYMAPPQNTGQAQPNYSSLAHLLSAIPVSGDAFFLCYRSCE